MKHLVNYKHEVDKGKSNFEKLRVWRISSLLELLSVLLYITDMFLLLVVDDLELNSFLS